MEAYDSLQSRCRGRDWRRVLPAIGMVQYEDDIAVHDALLDRFKRMGAVVSEVRNGNKHYRSGRTRVKVRTVISWPHGRALGNFANAAAYGDLTTSAAAEVRDLPTEDVVDDISVGIPDMTNERDQLKVEWVSLVAERCPTSCEHRGDAYISEEDIRSHSNMGRIPLEENCPLDAMEEHYAGILQSFLAKSAENEEELSGSMEETAMLGALQDLIEMDACITSGGVDVNKRIREDDPHGITTREVAYFLLKNKLETGTSSEQCERLARVCNLLNGGAESACPYTLHQLEVILEVEKAHPYLVHVCPRYCKVFDTDGDDEDEVCGVHGCTERRYDVRMLAHGKKHLIPREFIIHFGLHRALRRWFSLPEFWSLRAHPTARSHLDFWSGELVKRMDQTCGGEVLTEVAKVLPSGERMLERHGCCLSMGTDHFPLFQNRKRCVFLDYAQDYVNHLNIN